MQAFVHREGALWAERVSVETIVAEVGSPVFIYSSSMLRNQVRAVRDAFEPIGAQIRYAVKANANLSVLRLLLDEGCGFDVVSAGELYRARAAGCEGHKICFAGVSKSRAELESALGTGSGVDPVGLTNIESASELQLLDCVGREAGVRASALLRVNPDVDADTHRYTTTGMTDSKFGIEPQEAISLFKQSADFAGVELQGLHVHIGSPIRDPLRYAAAARRLADIAAVIRASGGRVGTLNLGGGFAHGYGEEAVEPISAYVDAVREAIAHEIDRGTRILIEPGRVVAAGAGLFVVRATHVKHTSHRSFALCDAGMNALPRPALYQAEHRVEPVRPRVGELSNVDIAGPLCESSDFLARDRLLSPLKADDLLAVFDAGAYAMSMASNYNEHPKPPEVLVDGDRWALIRERQSFEDMIRHDRFPEWRS